MANINGYIPETQLLASAMMRAGDPGGGIVGQAFYRDFLASGLRNLCFEAEWDKTRIVWKLDGQPYFEQTITNADQSEFHEPFFIIFNVAIGGKFPGYPSSSQTVFPQEMQVDWVRVYQRAN